MNSENVCLAENLKVGYIIEYGALHIQIVRIRKNVAQGCFSGTEILGTILFIDPKIAFSVFSTADQFGNEIRIGSLYVTTVPNTMEFSVFADEE